MIVGLLIIVVLVLMLVCMMINLIQAFEDYKQQMKRIDDKMAALKAQQINRLRAEQKNKSERQSATMEALTGLPPNIKLDLKKKKKKNTSKNKRG